MPRRRSREWILPLLALALAPLGCADEDVAARPDVGDGDATGGSTPLVETAYVQAWQGEAPVHDGETVTVEGVATVESGAIVSGRYLKFHVQDDSGGVAVFADSEATVDVDGYDGTGFAAVFVRLGDQVRVTGVIAAHDGQVELRPQSAADVEILAHGAPLPEPRAFASIAELYAAGREVVGQLVRVANVRLADPGAWPGDPAAKAKDVRLVDANDDTQAVTADIYPASGIPGSVAPAGPFELVGLCRIAGETLAVFPRSASDIAPTTHTLTGSIRITRFDALGTPLAEVDVATLPAFLRDGEPAVLLYDLLPAQEVPRPQDFRYKIVARDGRQPFDALPSLALRQGVLRQTVDASGQAVARSLDSRFYASLDLSPIYFLSDVDELRLFPTDPSVPQPGAGSCAEGYNVTIEGETYHVALDALTEKPLDIGGETVGAVPLGDIVSDAILGLFAYDGFLSADQVRVLYDYELAAEDGAAALVLTPEWLATAASVPGDRSLVFTAAAVDPPETPLSGLCHIRALRRFVVSNGADAVVLHATDLDERRVSIETFEGPTVALPLGEIVAASGLVTGLDALAGHDLRLIPSDLPEGVLFPWGHGHAESLYWRADVRKTVSSDTQGDLLDAAGEASFGGVAKLGWTAMKALREIGLSPAPDPEHTRVVGDLTLTDPDSCTGCHVKHGELRIPVRCEQCH